MNPSKPILLTLLIAILVPLTHPNALAAEKVEVTYKDGRKEEGELLKYDTEQVVLRIKMGGNRMDLKVPWTKIKELSNGLTPELVQKRWRENNKGKLCGTCKGEKAVACPKCRGSGRLAKKFVPCRTCKGLGTSPCRAKGCEQGKTPCPGKCLKLSEGKWEKRDDGLRWRKFTFPGGWREWSERHLGEVIEIEDGKPVNKGKCQQCSGTSKINCKVCNGTGNKPCSACKGQKEVPAPGVAPKCGDCKQGKVQCAACKGSGLKQ